MITTRPLGTTGEQVTELGLGGEGVLRTDGRPREAAAVITRALDLGVRYFDTAPAYASSLDYYGATLGERRDDIFLASKTAGRSRDQSLRILEDSLRRLRTDRLDLFQLHDLRTHSDLKRIFGPGGAVHFLDEARAAGVVRFVGLTGHHRPDVLLRAMAEYPFDTVLIPLNPADHVRLPFTEVLADARRRGMGVIAMKVMSAGLLLSHGFCTGLEALSYVWSLPGVSVSVVGCRTVAEVEENVRSALDHEAMDMRARRELEGRCAHSGLTPYKTAQVRPLPPQSAAISRHR